MTITSCRQAAGMPVVEALITNRVPSAIDKPSMARRPFQISAWGVKPLRQAFNSPESTSSTLFCWRVSALIDITGVQVATPYALKFRKADSIDTEERSFREPIVLKRPKPKNWRSLRSSDVQGQQPPPLRRYQCSS